MVFDAFRARLGSIIGGFDAAQSHRRMRGFRATRAHVNTLIAASGETITARARWLVRESLRLDPDQPDVSRTLAEIKGAPSG